MEPDRCRIQQPYPEIVESGGRHARSSAVAMLSATTLAQQGSALRITSPAADVIVSGSTRIEVAIEPAADSRRT